MDRLLRVVESFVYPLLVFSQSIPKVAIAPLFVVWFGFGVVPKIIAAFLLGFFPVVVSTVQGFKSVEPEMIDLARSMRRRALRIFLKFRLPQAMPAIFSGLKVSVTLAVVGAVVGEFVGSNSGMGYVLQKANGNFDLPLMFAALFVLSMIGVLLFLVDRTRRALADALARLAAARPQRDGLTDFHFDPATTGDMHHEDDATGSRPPRPPRSPPPGHAGPGAAQGQGGADAQLVRLQRARAVLPRQGEAASTRPRASTSRSRRAAARR